ncbi:MAG TPA: hypothetical protein VFH44_04905 [Solirubrobacterales bacterium]|nr:hypothetical protein [Solirubrobacterales bacterium]
MIRPAGHPLRGVAIAGGVATVVAIELRIFAPFDHGVWLVAYLLLVGTVAPLLLARGEQRLGAPAAGAAASGEAAAWLVGVAAVPAGVLADARLLVVAGGAALLAALASIARRSRPRDAGRASGSGRDLLIHGTVVGFMAVSTVVGIALAWDTPWL